MKVNFLPNNTKTVQCKIENPVSFAAEEVSANVDSQPVMPKVIRCQRFTKVPIIPETTGEYFLSTTTAIILSYLSLLTVLKTPKYSFLMILNAGQLLLCRPYDFNSLFIPA